MDSIKGNNMSHSWNIIRQQQTSGEDGHNQQNENHMSKCEEVRWEKDSSTLESIVHHAAANYFQNQMTSHDQNWGDVSRSVKQQVPPPASTICTSAGADHQKMKMIMRCDSQRYGTSAAEITNSSKNKIDDEHMHANDNDATTITWPYSLDEYSRSFNYCKTTSNHHTALDKKQEDHQIKSSRRNRTAAVHNQSERRRRDRINQKMKALQQLVPNAIDKVDKASMLEEVIKYLKQLEAQVKLLSSIRKMESEMMMPLVARKGMGGVGVGPGAGMANMTCAMAPTPLHPLTAPSLFYPIPTPFISPVAFPITPPIPPLNSTATSAAPTPNSFPFYAAFLAQSMSMELNKVMTTQHVQRAMNARSKKLNQESNQGRQTD